MQVSALRRLRTRQALPFIIQVTNRRPIASSCLSQAASHESISARRGAGRTGAPFFIGGIWLVFWQGPRIYGFFNPPAQGPWTPSRSTDRVSPKTDPTKYRPRPSSKNFKIQFGDASASPAPDLTDLHDAFTGAPLNPALGLSQCTNCQVYYHSESFVVLREENGGRCVACLCIRASPNPGTERKWNALYRPSFERLQSRAVRRRQ